MRYTDRFSKKRLRWTAVSLLLVIFCSLSWGRQIHTGFIAENTLWQTEYYIIDSEKDGPTVMITGGIHGNEHAGKHIAEQVIDWPVQRGKLIIVPRANKPAIEQDRRTMPDMDKEIANLNRNFPKNQNQRGSCLLSKELWQLVCDENPDWLVDLHEGYDFAGLNSKSVGSSVVASSLPEVRPQARSMIKTLNTTIDLNEKKFVLKGLPVKGSLARAAADLLNIKSFILETTNKDQPLWLRVNQHGIMLHRLLTNLEMIDFDVALVIKQLQHEDQFAAKK